jgi:hypothetical protein
MMCWTWSTRQHLKLKSSSWRQQQGKRDSDVKILSGDLQHIADEWLDLIHTPELEIGQQLQSERGSKDDAGLATSSQTYQQ